MSEAFTVYGGYFSQPSSRVVLFLSMAGESFAYRHVDLANRQQKSPEYLAINSFGRVPALTHGDLTLRESGVILTYLAEATGKFGARDRVEALRIQEWLSWIADVLLPLQRCRFLHRNKVDPEALVHMSKLAKNGLDKFEAHLAQHDFIEGGRVTIADIFAFPWIDLAHESGIDLAQYPSVTAWHARMMEQPGCKGHYDLMPKQDIG